LILRVIAIRAASIWRLVTHPCSIALRPYSPNCTRVPPLAMPRRRPRCGLRNLVRFGSSTTRRLPQGPRHLRERPAQPRSGRVQVLSSPERLLRGQPCRGSTPRGQPSREQPSREQPSREQPSREQPPREQPPREQPSRE